MIFKVSFSLNHSVICKIQSRNQVVNPTLSFPFQRRDPKPRKTLLRHERRMTTDAGQAGEEKVKVIHLLNSLCESRDDLAPMTANSTSFSWMMDVEK